MTAPQTSPKTLQDDKTVWPEEVRYDSAARELHITTLSGAHYHITAQHLRENSPSAEVRGHGSGPRIPVVGKEAVKIDRMVPVGRYAVRLVFDDGHDSGLYTWAYLKELSGAA